MQSGYTIHGMGSGSNGADPKGSVVYELNQFDCSNGRIAQATTESEEPW